MLAANRPLRLTLYALLAAVLYLPGLAKPALWEPDEGRYAEIAREMVVSGDYITPRDDYELYFEKPPLVYWAKAAAIKIFGINEFAIRLPAALFSIGQVVVTAALAEAMFGIASGCLAALALALSPLFFGFAQFATLDPALAFFLTAAMAVFYVAAYDDSFSRPISRRWMLLSAAMLALGTLAKGPVALLLGGVIAFIWLASERRLADISAMPLVACFFIYAVIVVPWFMIAEARNPGFLRFFIIDEHFERYATSNEHGWGPWFFIPIVIGGSWPWFFFVPLGWSAMHIRNGSGSAPAPSEHRRSDARFLGTWFVVVFVFFSDSPFLKLGTYILPALPPLAIVAAYGLASLRALDDARRGRLLAIVAMASLALAAALFVFFKLALAPINPALLFDGLLIAAALAAGAIAMYLIGPQYVTCSVRNRRDRARDARDDTAKPNRARENVSSISTYRNLASRSRPDLADDCTLASYRHYVQSLPFYTRRRETRVEYWGELSEVLPAFAKSPFVIGSEARLHQAWSSGACMILIANSRDLPSLLDSLKPAPAIIGCEGKKLALYNGSLAPPPAAGACLQSVAKNE